MKSTEIDRAAAALANASRVFVITGAGISAESGIPTFRGVDGLWRSFSAFDLATPEAFERDPVLVWEWYLWRRGIVSQAKPNAAHLILAEWEKRFPHFLIGTQNVDRLHQRAGSRSIVEIHGNILESRCATTGRVFKGDEINISVDQLPPRSPAGGLLRPNVVWFGEMLPAAPLKVIDKFFADGKPDITFIIGTTGVLMYIQSLVTTACAEGSLIVEINPEETAVTLWADIALRGTACAILTALNESLPPQRA